ncbi:MAG: 4-hydroxy-tetrahydrodipicolinate reductase [Clostridia bacterium]|nr:4-hydroxy-tetrahydrodipicolinate reductase [Clostridia bacterium]
MKRILLSGCSGKMGKVIASCVKARTDCEIAAGVDITGERYDVFPVYKSFDDVTEKADVIIDFSHPSALGGVLNYAVANSLPAVIATTGMDAQHIEMINEAAGKTAVFFTYNMSIGVNLLADLAKRATAILGEDFDIEIIEAHHNQKIDAPSGTAIMLADAVTSATDTAYHFEYDRHSKRQKRDKREIGIHSIRGGTIVGEHQVIFAGRDEIITLSHSARSKEIFAVGSINAALYLVGKNEGIYNMSDLVASK